MASNNTMPMGPPPAALDANPATVIGPIVIGTLITWLLMGTLIVQTFIFHVNSATERVFIRILVFVLVCMDMAQTLFMTYETWFYTVLNFNNEAILTGASPWTAATIPIMAGLISVTVQLFYAWRIWILSKQMFMRGMAILIVLIALGQSLAAIVASSIFSLQPTQTNLLKLHPVFDFWLAGSFSTDILISGSMIYILWKARSHTTWASSERLIDRLIINVIQTGTLTVICAGVDLAFFVGLEATNLHLAPAIVLGKLYSNSLLATLNMRNTRRNKSSPSTAVNTDSIAMRVQVSRLTERNPMENTTDLTSEWPEGKLRDSDSNKASAYDLQEQMTV